MCDVYSICIGQHHGFEYLDRELGTIQVTFITAFSVNQALGALRYQHLMCWTLRANYGVGVFHDLTPLNVSVLALFVMND